MADATLDTTTGCLSQVSNVGPCPVDHRRSFYLEIATEGVILICSFSAKSLAYGLCTSSQCATCRFNLFLRFSIMKPSLRLLQPIKASFRAGFATAANAGSYSSKDKFRVLVVGGGKVFLCCRVGMLAESRTRRNRRYKRL